MMFRLFRRAAVRWMIVAAVLPLCGCAGWRHRKDTAGESAMPGWWARFTANESDWKLGLSDRAREVEGNLQRSQPSVEWPGTVK